MTRSEEIHAALEVAFTIDHLEVFNESAQHAGHAGHDGSGESHFRVEIKAPEFSGLNHVARHRAVHAALGADLIGKIHALSLDIKS